MSNGLSINDFIVSHAYSLQYTNVDDTIQIYQNFGKGAPMAKIDLKMPFVYAQSIAMTVISSAYIGVTSFSSKMSPRSAQYLFNLVADAMDWILTTFTYKTIFPLCRRLIFFFAGPPQSDTCFKALSVMLFLCRAVQAPVKLEKVFNPSTTLSILGILLDTIAGEA